MSNTKAFSSVGRVSSSWYCEINMPSLVSVQLEIFGSSNSFPNGRSLSNHSSLHCGGRFLCRSSIKEETTIWLLYLRKMEEMVVKGLLQSEMMFILTLVVSF
ncbi:hypothetical protein L1049_018241 [Liquidambar formosana]|uniref:Uncharacterized protein n=1 Tax=Liquidambar formosana TaxID=63359 RepID=A0AAP0WMK8_LIQFO